MKEFLKKNRDLLYFILAISASLIFFASPLPENLEVGEKLIMLSHQGRITMALLVFAVVLWVTEAVPFAVTSLLVMILMPLLGATEGLLVAKDNTMVEIHGAAAGLREMIKMGFGNRLILFFLGVFLLSGAFIKSGLGDRLTLILLRVFGTRTKMIILGFLFMGAALSMWITDMAVAALLVPLALSILEGSNIKPLRSNPRKNNATQLKKPLFENSQDQDDKEGMALYGTNFGKALMIACCWGAVFGGIGTPAGCGPNPIAIEYLKNLAGIRISFLEWMKIGVPLSFILVPFGWLVLITIFPQKIKRLPIERKEIRKKLKEIGPLRKNEATTLIVFLSVITLWVFGDFITKISGGSIVLSMELVALLGGLFFFFPGIRIFSWDEAEPLMNWGAIVLVMASLALGLMMYETGAARWLAWLLLGKIQIFPSLVQIALVVAVVLFMKIFLASNTVTGIIVIPLLITLAADLGVDPWFLVAPAAFTSSLGVILLTQSPTNIIPFSPGYFTVRDFAVSGIALTFIMIIVLTAVISIIGPLMGAYNF